MFNTSYDGRQFFSKVMNTMFKGMLLTTLAAAVSALIMQYAGYGFAMLYMFVSLILCVVELVIVFKFRNDVMKLEYEKANRHFILYSIVSGITLGVTLSFYSPFAIVMAFAITCAYFGLLHAITTQVKTDFSLVGSICISALIPLIIASILLIFIHSEAMYWFVTYAGILIFTGLTLYDFKRIENAYTTITPESEDSMVLYLALELYLDFLNLFLYIIRIVGRRK